MRNRNHFFGDRDLHLAGLVMTRKALQHIVRVGTAGSVAALTLVAAVAQDVPGIEICTRESRLDRRTSCLQSNVEFLQQVLTKNALDAQQRLAAANREIATLKEQLAAASHDLTTLKDALAAVEARIEQLQKANAAAGPQKPEAKPPSK